MKNTLEPAKIRVMRIGLFEFNEPLPELNEPHAISILRPWVNVGRVGTLSLARLERHFSAKSLGKRFRPGMVYDFTRYRPRSRLVGDRREMTIPNSTVSYSQRDNGPDLLFMNLREPHLMGEDYVDSVLEMLGTLGAKRYCMIGGMYDVVPHTRPLLVSGASTGSQASADAERMKLQPSSYQGPTSIMSLIGQEAAKRGIENMSFVVHLPQYVQLEEDYAGVARLMEMVCSLYGLPEHLADKERGERQYRELTSAVQRNPELQDILSQLERQYDSRSQREAEDEELPPLSSEVERFLREVGDLGEEENS